MSEFCQNCEGYYDTVFRVPDDVWERLTGHTDGAGLLCPACCELLARRVGLELYWEAAVGEYPVAAEREACCAVNAKLLEACEALVVRIDEWMALDMPCPLCDGYVPHFDDCPYTFAADAIRARAGEVVEVER